MSRLLPTPPKPFESDGASGLISAVYRRIYGKEIPWVECAIKHDWKYHFGGPEHLRLDADRELARCVSVEHDHPKLSIVVYLGVRLGGWWFIPYPSARWGKGYDWPQRGPQDPDYVTPPITDEALNVRTKDEITGKEV